MKVQMPPKIYTKTGDKGKTSLFGGQKVPKDHLRLEAYGSIDELNSHLGLIQAQLAQLAFGETSEPKEGQDWLERLQEQIESIQNYLFNLGSHLATPKAELQAQLPPLSESPIADLEQSMDLMSVELPPLQQFILPGGSPLASHLHVARTLCRRTERAIVRLHQVEPVENSILQYINRLSDWLFVSARYANLKLGFKDQTWSS